MYHYDKTTRTHIWQNRGTKDVLARYLKTEQEADSKSWNVHRNLKNYKKNVLDSFSGSDREWAFGSRSKNPEEFVEDVITGISRNDKVLNRLERLVKETKFEHNSKAQKRRRKRSEFDGEFNFERGMAGESEIFDVKTKVDNDRAIDFYIGNNCLAEFEGETYEKRVVEFMAKVYKAIQLGYMVKISTFGLNKGVIVGGDDGCFINVVKDYKDPIDLHLIANICHIAFFRSFGFANEIICIDEQGFQCEMGMGKTLDNPKEVLPILKSLDTHKGFYYQMTTNNEVNIKTGEVKQYKLN